MKNIITLTVIILFFASCERDIVFEVISETPPELHVIVKDADANKVSGAIVTVYKSADDRDNSSGQLASVTTNGDGKAVFTEDNLKEPGIFYLRVESNNLTALESTPYLLLNDGHTYFNVTIQ